MINKKNYKKLLKYYSFDFDDNLLFTETKIHLEKYNNGHWFPISLSTAEFRTARHDDRYRVYEDYIISFGDFFDEGERGEQAFIEDIIDSVKGKRFGPSWKAFIKCITSGNIFSIITSRGHKSRTIKNGIKYIIDNVLSEKQKQTMYANCLKFAYIFKGDGADIYEKTYTGKLSHTKLINKYLDACEFFGVSSDEFIDRFGIIDRTKPEISKAIAMKFFVEKIHKYSLKINSRLKLGFSDDDIKNIEHMINIFKNELSLKYAIEYRVYDTSNHNIPGGVKTYI